MVDEKLMGDVHALYARAEGFIKSLEHTHGLFVPTVNQLRYAGKHLTDYLSGIDGEDAIIKARNHCQRAIYDACDAHIQSMIFEVELFQQEYADIVVSDVFPEYRVLLQKKAEALKFLEETTAHSSRVEMYQSAIEHKEELERIVAGIPIVRDELNKRLGSERRQKISQWAGYIIGIIGVLLAVLQFMFSLL